MLEKEVKQIGKCRWNQRIWSMSSIKKGIGKVCVGVEVVDFKSEYVVKKNFNEEKSKKREKKEKVKRVVS